MVSIFDYNYDSLRRFFQDGKKHLAANGKLILGSSNIARLRVMKKMAKNEGYKISMLYKTIAPPRKNRKSRMDLRIYSFEPERTFNLDI